MATYRFFYGKIVTILTLTQNHTRSIYASINSLLGVTILTLSQAPCRYQLGLSHRILNKGMDLEVLIYNSNPSIGLCGTGAFFLTVKSNTHDFYSLFPSTQPN